MVHKIIVFFSESLEMLLFFLRLIIKEDLNNYIKKAGTNNICKSKKLVILGNGPSLADVLKDWKNNNNFKEVDFSVVNYFCLDKTFSEIKPKYYVLSDPQFFDYSGPLKDKVDEMYLILNEKVTWKMFLYIQYYAWNSIDWSNKIVNKNIKVIPFHSIIYTGYDALRNWFLKHGLCAGNYGTVILNSEIIGLNIGYKELYLYGVDHNFFDNLCINDKNQLCAIITHFYDNKPVLKPLNYPGKATIYTVSLYLREKSYLFYGHEVVRSFANYCSAKIYNCTKNSLIDAYDRL